tara:strand:- start:9284 stop:12643 length:3360 start_codon:yes stop_codon:yes gene_type:complete
MSDLSQLFANIGGALSAQSTGGSQGLQNFMSVLAQQQAQQSSQDFRRESMAREQVFTLHRDRQQRAHEEKMQAAQLKQKQTLGVEADNSRAVAYLAQAGTYAQAQGGTALAQWQGFENSLIANGYLAEGARDYGTPQGQELLKTALAGYVGNVGADLARTSYGRTEKEVADRRDQHFQMYGTAAPPNYSSDQLISDSNHWAVASANLGKHRDEANRLRGLIDDLKVTEQDTAESLHSRILPIATDYARLMESLHDMTGVWAPDESGQVVRAGDTVYTPFLTGAAPLAKDYSALTERAADLRSIIDSRREALKAQVYNQRDIGQTGELMVNVPGWGGAADSAGNPIELEDRAAYFNGPVYRRENEQYRDGVNTLVNLSEDEAKAQGLFPLWQQYQAATSKDGEPLYSDLAYWADLQFAGSPTEQATATEAIKGVFNLNPARVRAKADIERGNKADLEEAVVGVNSLNLDIGHTIIEEGEIAGLRDSHGKEVKVADGFGGEEVVRRIVDIKETVARWAADPNSDAVDRLAVASLETTPAHLSVDYDPDRRSTSLREHDGYVLDKELLDHRVDQMAENLGLDNTRTQRIKERAWALYNSERDFVLSDNPLAADVPTAATPRLNLYKSVFDTPAGQATGSTLTALLNPDEQVELLDSELSWLSDSYSVDRGPQLIANLRAQAATARGGATQAKSSSWNPFGAADSEAIELGVQVAGDTDFSQQELLDVYANNGGSELFTEFLTTPGNAASRSKGMVDRAYQTTERLSFAVQYKKQQDRAGVQVDNQVHNRLALLDAMRGQKDPLKRGPTQRAAVNPEQRATLLMVRDTLRSLTYDQALAFYGSDTSTGMPFRLIEEGQDVLDPVERRRVEDYLDLSTEAKAIANNQEELARAATTVSRNRFAVYDEDGEDIFKPYDEALFTALSTQNEGDLAAIEEINTAWQSEDLHAELDPILIDLFSDITSPTPGMMALKFDPDTEDGRALIAALTGEPYDQIKQMFQQMPFQKAVNEIRDADSWTQGIDPLLETLSRAQLARIDAMRAQTGIDSRPTAKAVVRARINEYGAMRERTAINLQRLQEAKGRPLEVTDFNPEVRDYLRQKSFSSVLDFDAKVNLVFAASLYTY